MPTTSKTHRLLTHHITFHLSSSVKVPYAIKKTIYDRNNDTVVPSHPKTINSQKPQLPRKKIK